MEDNRLLTKPSLLIIVVGVLLFLIAVIHHVREFLVMGSDIGPLVAFLLDGPPALGLTYAGYWLLETELTQEDQWTASLWCLTGIVMFVVLMGLSFFIRIIEGRVIAEPIFPLLIAAEGGGLVGFIAGYYNARARKDAKQAKAAREQLKMVNRELETSNKQLEQFAYAASHDLQEPLRMINSYLQLLEERYSEQLDEDAEEFIDYAVDGAARMEEMIDSLLAFSRVETEGEPFEPVDLNAVVDDVMADLQFQIDEHDAEILVEDLPRVEGDDGQLRQLFQNLLENAIEYRGEEPPQVHVSAERDGSNWLISVHDEGIGIDPEETDRIFDIFQRLHTQEEHTGTGIGLAMCKRIVERHGGEIWVESEPGEGSTFFFTVPAIQTSN